MATTIISLVRTRHKLSRDVRELQPLALDDNEHGDGPSLISGMTGSVNPIHHSATLGMCCIADVDLIIFDSLARSVGIRDGCWAARAHAAWIRSCMGSDQS
jgi:hypothetical protein